MQEFDVVIIGGSYAGMAAALPLARARRLVAVVDAGMRRNRFVDASHGVLGHDGKSPAALAAEAKAQLLKYPNLTWIDDTAVGAVKQKAQAGGADVFVIKTGEGRTLAGRRLILGTGVKDTLPDIPGLQDRWGCGVFHCPYCHGYEMDGMLGVLAVGDVSMHQALLVPEWGPTTLFLNGTFTPDAKQQKQLDDRAVSVEPARIVSVAPANDGKCPGLVLKLEDGREAPLAGLFVATTTHVDSPIAEQLGCKLTPSPLGAYIETAHAQETCVSGLYACGDIARATGSLTAAIADGALAGLAAHSSLVFEGVED